MSSSNFSRCVIDPMCKSAFGGGIKIDGDRERESERERERGREREREGGTGTGAEREQRSQQSLLPNAYNTNPWAPLVCLEDFFLGDFLFPFCAVSRETLPTIIRKT